MGSQKYGTLVGGHFGWQCAITLEQCPIAKRTHSKKPECKGCKIARELKTGARAPEKVINDISDEIDFSSGQVFDIE